MLQIQCLRLILRPKINRNHTENVLTSLTLRVTLSDFIREKIAVLFAEFAFSRETRLALAVKWMEN